MLLAVTHALVRRGTPPAPWDGRAIERAWAGGTFHPSTELHPLPGQGVGAGWWRRGGRGGGRGAVGAWAGLAGRPARGRMGVGYGARPPLARVQVLWRLADLLAEGSSAGPL